MNVEETELIDQFVGSTLEQLYVNREKHIDSKDKSIEFMALICSEQVGQLSEAVATGNKDGIKREIFHVAAILFEIFIRN